MFLAIVQTTFFSLKKNISHHTSLNHDTVAYGQHGCILLLTAISRISHIFARLRHEVPDLYGVLLRIDCPCAHTHTGPAGGNEPIRYALLQRDHGAYTVCIVWVVCVCRCEMLLRLLAMCALVCDRAIFVSLIRDVGCLGCAFHFSVLRDYLVCMM
jgi:hypothetical protein